MPPKGFPCLNTPAPSWSVSTAESSVGAMSGFWSFLHRLAQGLALQGAPITQVLNAHIKG